MVGALLAVALPAWAARPVLTGAEQLAPSADGHFLIHYTLTGADALAGAEDTAPANGMPDAVDDVELGLHAVWAAFVEEDQWPAPPPDEGRGGDDRLDVYLREIDINGYAHYEPVAAGGYTAYLEIDRAGRNQGALTLQSVAGHELHHALQAAYTPALSSWIYEATSTWAQYRLFQGSLVMDTARQVLWTARLQHPEYALDTTGNRYEYAGMTWIQFLVDHGALPRTGVRRLWEAMAAAGDWEAGHRAFLAEPLEETVAAFHTWNLFACSEDDGRHYDPNGLPCEFETGVPARALVTYPASVTTTQTGRLGAVYLSLEPDCGAPTAVVHVQGTGPFLVRGVGVGQGEWAAASADGSPVELRLPGWNLYAWTRLVLVNTAAAAQAFQVEVATDSAPLPGGPGAVDGWGARSLWVEPAGPRRVNVPDAVVLRARGEVNPCHADADVSDTVEWQSSDEETATVQHGVVVPKRAGHVEITVQAARVSSAPVAIEFTDPEGTMGCTQGGTPAVWLVMAWWWVRWPRRRGR